MPDVVLVTDAAFADELQERGQFVDVRSVPIERRIAPQLPRSFAREFQDDFTAYEIVPHPPALAAERSRSMETSLQVIEMHLARRPARVADRQVGHHLDV